AFRQGHHVAFVESRLRQPLWLHEFAGPPRGAAVGRAADLARSGATHASCGNGTAADAGGTPHAAEAARRGVRGLTTGRFAVRASEHHGAADEQVRYAVHRASIAQNAPRHRDASLWAANRAACGGASVRWRSPRASGKLPQSFRIVCSAQRSIAPTRNLHSALTVPQGYRARRRRPIRRSGSTPATRDRRECASACVGHRSAPRSTQALTSSGARLARGPIENLAARLVDVSITDFRRAVGNKPSPARVTGPSRAVAFRPSNRRQIQLGSGAIVIEINDLYKYYDHRRA